MKKLLFVFLFAATMVACEKGIKTDDMQVTNNEKVTTSEESTTKCGRLTNKDKVWLLLKSIETGDSGPIAYINPNKYIQHNQSVADGLAGFGAVLGQLPEGSARVNTIRLFGDGDFVIAHTDYNFFGPKIGIDIFRFEDGLIVEHWDNLQETVTKTASGHSMIDGPAAVQEKWNTWRNKNLVKNMVNDIFLGANPSKITDYISTTTYIQHDPLVKDGLAGLNEALGNWAAAGTPMVFEKNHAIFGEGNFVLSVSEGKFLGKNVAFYDLFRVDDEKVVEHWDVIQEILPNSQALNENGKFNF